MSNIKQIRFHSIDDWNRPIYKVVDLDVCLVDTDHLFNYGTPKEVVDEYYKEHWKDLTIYGSLESVEQECDPLGTRLKADIILEII